MEIIRAVDVQEEYRIQRQTYLDLEMRIARHLWDAATKKLEYRLGGTVTGRIRKEDKYSIFREIYGG